MYLHPTLPAAARATFPTLPKGMERDGLVALIDAVAPRLGIGSAALATFRAMIAMTKPRAFKTGREEPCCYANQSEVARLRGLAPSRIRAHERELEAVGLIEKRTMANGARSGFSGCGIYFTCAVVRVREFVDLLSAAEEDRRARMQIRNQRSAYRRKLRKTLHDLDSAEVNPSRIAEIRAAMALWPSAAALHRMSREALEEHVEHVRSLWKTLVQLADQRSESCGRPLENERCHIQDPIEDFTIPRGPEASGWFEADRPRSGHKGAGVSPNLASELSLRLGQCSDEMKFYLQSVGGSGHPPIWEDLRFAARMRRSELGISSTAWSEAVEAAGEDGATVCLLMLDRAAAASVSFIIYPDAYLAALVRKLNCGAVASDRRIAVAMSTESIDSRIVR